MLRALLLLRPLAALAGTALLVHAARGIPGAMGAGAAALREVAARSPHASGGRFRNTQPDVVIAGGAATLARVMVSRGGAGRPTRPVPLAPAGPAGPAGPLAVTWMGHASMLIELDGHRVLTDPMWSERASPSRAIGPRRLHPVPVPLADLPAVDAVVISHDHYDHLDLRTVRALVGASTAPFLVPLGVGEHLRCWGVPDDRIVELDWNGSAKVGDLVITCAEARHFSGRGLTRNTTQWASWALTGPAHRVFFGGDTGFHDAFTAIGDRLGPFDLALLPIGAYSDLWPEIHMTPEEAVRAHDVLRVHGLLVPVHWGTFDLGFHGWAEPVQRLLRAAQAAGVRVAVPRPGERVDAAAPPPFHDWWSPLV